MRPTTTLRLPEGLLTLAAPSLADGPDWSTARLANRTWLEPAFPAWGSDWEAEQSEVAWAERWWAYRRMALAGGPVPFVIRLDGRLLGEIGINAVDHVSGLGEAMAWMVQDHGSSKVMNAASLVVIHDALTGDRPVQRILSPTAATSRAGRSPGLSAVGFQIEATVPRKVGSQGLVDHDMWIVHNTAHSRATVANAVCALSAQTVAEDRRAPVPRPSSRDQATLLTRVAVRMARAGVRRIPARVGTLRAATHETRTVSTSTASVTLRRASRRDVDALDAGPRTPPGSVRWAVVDGDRPVAVIAHHTDAGTGTTEVFVVAAPRLGRDALAAALEAVLDDVRPAAHEPRLLVLRQQRGSVEGTPLDADLLVDLGLQHIAAYRGSAETSDGWRGEDVWRVPAAI